MSNSETALNQCHVCASNDVERITSFQPYSNMSWVFDIYKCAECKTVFAKREEGVKYFETLYSESMNYRRFSFLGRVVKSLYARRLGFLVKWILRGFPSYQYVIDSIKTMSVRHKSLKVLEVGCSTGFLTEYFNQNGHECYGVDIAEEAILTAKKLFRPDRYSMSFPKGKFDVIFFCGLGGGVDDFSGLMESCLLKLAPDGVILTNLPNATSVEASNSWVDTPPPDVVTLFNPQFKDKWLQGSSLSFNIQVCIGYQRSVKKIKQKYPIKFAYSNKGKIPFKYRSFLHLFAVSLIQKTRVRLQLVRSLFSNDKRENELNEYGVFVRITNHAPNYN